MDEDARERDDEPVALETRGVGAEMAAQGVLALALGAAPAHAFLTALAPLVARALDASARELAGVRLRRVGSMLSAATDAAGSDETLAAAIAGSEEAQELAFDTAEAASRSRVPEAVIAMGRALANGLLSDGTKLEQSRLVIEALASLEPPHVRVLVEVYEVSGVGGLAYLEGNLEEWREELPRLFAALQREGLIELRDVKAERTWDDFENGFPQTWFVTKFGMRALELLRDVGAGEVA